MSGAEFLANRAEHSHNALSGRLPVLDFLVFPFRGKRIGVTTDPDHFRDIDISNEVLIPLRPHPGAFGFTRTHHTHEGVDLYCPEGEPVCAMEAGIVVAILNFTGPSVGSPWWHETRAVFVEGRRGVLNYGEIRPRDSLKLGDRVERGEEIGNVLTVLRKDKGRPRTMLHLEWYPAGTREPAGWEVGKIKPRVLLDPTPLLLEAMHGNNKTARAVRGSE